MRWALDHWDVACPAFIGALDACIEDDDGVSDDIVDALFIIVHLFGERREKRAFPSLCKFLQEDAERAEFILGDAISETLANILISTFDGDPAPLKAVIESETANEFVRDSALIAMAYLTATGEIAQTDMRAYLLRLRKELQPQDEHYIWQTWATVAAFLGYADYSGVVKRLFDLGYVAEEVMEFEHFEEDLALTLADPARMAGFTSLNIGPFTDAIGELSKWNEEREGSSDDAWEEGAEPAADEPVTNPFKDVGRNDPCPCGSGKKFKKCCLPSLA
jgi:hypothetical protein